MLQFEKPDVWQEDIALRDRLDVVTKWNPGEVRFGPTPPKRRSAISISANIAEGSGSASDAEYRRFIEIASGSLIETASHLTLAHRQILLLELDFQALYSHCERVGKMRSALRNRLKNG